MPVPAGRWDLLIKYQRSLEFADQTRRVAQHALDQSIEARKAAEDYEVWFYSFEEDRGPYVPDKRLLDANQAFNLLMWRLEQDYIGYGWAS